MVQESDVKTKAKWRVMGIGAIFSGCVACSSLEKGGIDGISCPARAIEAKAVYIDVGYDDKGMPYVPGSQTCSVYPGTMITWRTKEGEVRPFEIAFKNETPAEIVNLGKRDSGQAIAGRYKYVITAKYVPRRQSYKYSIFANGHELDPEVIIESQTPP